MNKVMFASNEQKKIGMLTPSSNTTLEPICSGMVHGLEKLVTMHYGRFEVTKISLEEDALNQFDTAPMLEASRLLSHADVDVIAWNGTSGGWLGLDADLKLCKDIEEYTGIPATTSMISQLKAFEKYGVKKIHLVTPYLTDINEKLIDFYKKADIRVVNSVCLNQYVNRSFALVTQDKIMEMFAQVCTAEADGVSVVCTNLPAMWSVPALEEKYRIPVYDTINTVVWDTLRMVGIDSSVVKGWGSLFQK
ncbi:MAG: aspartate/glutamate racemase family protein [Lachnospiraceae bacterium]|nr:aspartate/glutamate racemase family protein [Lachnospiraceae bacterium]